VAGVPVHHQILAGDDGPAPCAQGERHLVAVRSDASHEGEDRPVLREDRGLRHGVTAVHDGERRQQRRYAAEAVEGPAAQQDAVPVVDAHLPAARHAREVHAQRGLAQVGLLQQMRSEDEREIG